MPDNKSAGEWHAPTPGWSPPPADWTPPPPMVVRPVRLDGRIVRLETLADQHIPGLMRAGANPELWHWTLEWLDTPEKLRAYLAVAERARDDGSQLPFATIDQASDEIIGSTRFLSIDRPNHRLEIGYTWVVPGRQRGGANLEAKLLQLTHAFETLECRRVEFKTDSLNDKSRNALLGIGATFEGIFRNHMISQGGRMRHSAYYSLIDSEWPAAKRGLEERLARHLES
jgi:RimJ/RimL family protein N-acetyltransferase